MRTWNDQQERGIILPLNLIKRFRFRKAVEIVQGLTLVNESTDILINVCYLAQSFSASLYLSLAAIHRLVHALVVENQVSVCHDKCNLIMVCSCKKRNYAICCNMDGLEGIRLNKIRQKKTKDDLIHL